MKQSELYLLRQDYLFNNYKYKMLHHSEFNYEILNKLLYFSVSSSVKWEEEYLFHKILTEVEYMNTCSKLKTELST